MAPSPPASRMRRSPSSIPRAIRRGAVLGLGVAEQPCTVQLLHHQDGEGRHRRHAEGLDGSQRRRHRAHRRGRPGVLQRRQHQGVRRVLQRAANRVRPVHGPVQCHGGQHPERQEARHLPCQWHARGRRSGDRRRLRPGDRFRSGRLRAGRPAAWLGAGGRLHRLPALVPDDRGRDVELHILRAVERLQDGSQGIPQQGRPGHQAGGNVDPKPDGDHRDVCPGRGNRLRRVQDRRGGSRRRGTS